MQVIINIFWLFTDFVWSANRCIDYDCNKSFHICHKYLHFLSFTGGRAGCIKFENLTFFKYNLRNLLILLKNMEINVFEHSPFLTLHVNRYIYICITHNQNKIKMHVWCGSRRGHARFIIRVRLVYLLWPWSRHIMEVTETGRKNNVHRLHALHLKSVTITTNFLLLLFGLKHTHFFSCARKEDEVHKNINSVVLLI